MFEIFNAKTGEKHGRADTEAAARARCLELSGLKDWPEDGYCGYDFEPMPQVASEALRDRARELYQTDDLEIDDAPAISPNDHSTWVAAWVHVPAADDDDGGECRTCSDAIETRAFPCDECGAIDESLDDDDE